MPEVELPSNAREYGLAAPEAELLSYTRQHLDAIFAGVISNVAASRLGYRVTEHTQFRLKNDFSGVIIWENRPAHLIDRP
jgi:hypothetical protein